VGRVIEANPQDINLTDYVLPDGTKVPITIGDYRQLSEALFHSGTSSGSEYEYTDTANRLHFYITNVHRDADRAVPQGRRLPPVRHVQRLAHRHATAAAGQQTTVPVYTKAGTGPLAKVTLTATSESDPTKSPTATCIAIKH
jgi:hypothetical protein